MSTATTSKRQRRMARQAQNDASTPGGPHHPESPAGARPEGTRSVGSGKTVAVLALLKRETGATLDELVGVTGWLPHSARVALSGLKKKGNAIERFKVDGISRYKIVEPVSQ
jgi:hypothetical protein